MGLCVHNKLLVHIRIRGWVMTRRSKEPIDFFSKHVEENKWQKIKVDKDFTKVDVVLASVSVGILTFITGIAASEAGYAFLIVQFILIAAALSVFLKNN